MINVSLIYAPRANAALLEELGDLAMAAQNFSCVGIVPVAGDLISDERISRRRVFTVVTRMLMTDASGQQSVQLYLDLIDCDPRPQLAVVQPA